VQALSRCNNGKLVVFLVSVRSRKLICPLVSVVELSCRMLCILLAYYIAEGLVCEESQIIKMSSMYLE
jgi:hypothetical protein